MADALVYAPTPMTSAAKWNQPYLETCCRSALHRLLLAGEAGRPATSPDAACLRRLMGFGLAAVRTDGQIAITPAGLDRHTQEIAPTR